MVFQRDTLFDAPQTVVDFAFDERTVAVFPDMVHRSIPAYAALVQMLSVMVADRVQGRERAVIYDLGASLGGVSLALARTCPLAEIMAVDCSAAMIARLKAIVAEVGIDNIAVLEADILALELVSCDVVVMNFVMQFIALQAREVLLAKVFASLKTGGALFLAEKVLPENPAMTGWHEAFKRAQGYSELAIAQKREALERVMQTERAVEIVERLQRVGFTRVTPYFQGLMFCGWVAEKCK